MNLAMWMAWGLMAGFAGVYGWVWEKAGARGRKWLEWGLAVLVAGVSLASVVTHEPWKDELHAWLKARDLTVCQLWKEMAYEGHLLTWHFLLHPFARTGAPVWTMGLLSWAINAATVTWFARKAPWSGLAKAVAGMSCMFLYVNPVISRPYVLVPAVLFGLASLWGKRDERPVSFGVLVALLANTHVYLEGVAVSVFLVFAWTNVFRRMDGKPWRQCGRQCTGLAVMALGGLIALGQVLPSVWKSNVDWGPGPGIRNLSLWCKGCNTWLGVGAMIAGLVWLGMTAWRRDRTVFCPYVVGMGYMLAFSLVVWPTFVINRAVLWWVVALSTAWILEKPERERPGRGGNGRWRGAVVLMGLALLRPDMTIADWRWDFDPLRRGCQFIAERYGRDAEVWINGEDLDMEGALAYLDNVFDWRTGKRAESIRFVAGREGEGRSFEDCREDLFLAQPDRESVLVFWSMPRGGVTAWDTTDPFVEVEWQSPRSVCPWSSEMGVMRVWRGSPPERSAFWLQTGMELAEHGELVAAMEAWKRSVRIDGKQWKAMNNLAWVLLEEGRTAEAREWIDRAMANAEARGNAGVWDTESAVRWAEGNEAGARDAEKKRDEWKKDQRTMNQTATDTGDLASGSGEDVGEGGE